MPISRRPSPFPVIIGGSTITDERVSGPPSKVYPVLRDLAAFSGTVIIEIDTTFKRVVGKVDGVGATSNNREATLLVVAPDFTYGTNARGERCYKGDAVQATDPAWQRNPSDDGYVPANLADWEFGKRGRTGYPFEKIIAFRVLAVIR